MTTSRDDTAGQFSANEPQSVALWGSGVPKNWDKLSDVAKITYADHYNFSMMLTMGDQKKSHKEAMAKVKVSHKLKNGLWE